MVVWPLFKNWKYYIQIFELVLRQVQFFVYRLFHSLMNLKNIIGHSALLLILKDKNSYDSYSSDILLEMVSLYLLYSS